MPPLVARVFHLLIFFLVATGFHPEEREMQIALPVAQSAGTISVALRALVINIDGQGRIIVSGREISPEDLHGIVVDALAANPEQKVTIRGDRSVAYEAVVRVLDICKTGGLQEPYLDTVLND